ncbi:MAG TPA: MraY family glycosyltransferase [Ignavibacteriaceae bacterium]|nr:MraY family glycosyltransferase [Ignavibacteriaceae bacterium]
MSRIDHITIIQIILTLPVCFLLTKLAIIAAKKYGFISNPNPIVENHKIPVAFGGGIAIGMTIIIFLIFQSFNYQQALKFILIILPVIVIGLMDDIFEFTPFVKLGLEALSVLPFIFFYINVPGAYLAIFLLFILISQNSWNMVDIMDGLVSGISFIIFLSVGIILLPITELEFYSILSFAIAISSLGFRFLNMAPAKIFLGETGSLLLGTLFSFILINVYLVDKITAYFLVLLGSVPFFELFFLVIVRSRKGISIYKKSPDHFALRMLHNGYSVQTINRKVILASAINSLIIIVSIIFSANFFVLLICLSLILLGASFAFVYFQSLPVKESKV